MTASAREHLYNAGSGLFESGEQKQISYASQIWMILGGGLSKTESRKASTAVQANKNEKTTLTLTKGRTIKKATTTGLKQFSNWLSIKRGVLQRDFESSTESTQVLHCEKLLI
jgi:hypothetical protein